MVEYDDRPDGGGLEQTLQQVSIASVCRAVAPARRARDLVLTRLSTASLTIDGRTSLGAPLPVARMDVQCPRGGLVRMAVTLRHLGWVVPRVASMHRIDIFSLHASPGVCLTYGGEVFLTETHTMTDVHFILVRLRNLGLNVHTVHNTPGPLTCRLHGGCRHMGILATQASTVHEHRCARDTYV